MQIQELTLQAISKRFRKVQALQDVSYTFRPGITALLGPNGAGKSTMMNIICTLLKQDAGTVQYNSLDIQKMGTAYLEKLSVQFQSQPMFRGDTAMEHMHFCGALKGIPPTTVKTQSQELLRQFGIADTGRKPIYTFSGGMRQRLALASTFLGNPEIILLDEPSAGLDIYEREVLKRYLCEQKKEKIIIVSTHIVSDVENIADNIVLLSSGRIYANGSQAALISKMDGQIWQIPEEAEISVPTYYSDSKRLCHSEVPPHPGAIPKNADLTDVYFSCIKAR